MRVLLISPPFYRLMGSHFNGLHLGLAYLGAVLKKEGHTVGLYNADYISQDWYSDQSAIFHGFEQYKKALEPSLPIWKEIQAAISDFSPDLLGITLYTGAWQSMLNIARMVRAQNPATKIAVGGPHPTLDLQGTTILVKEGLIDYVVAGEGEEEIAKLAQDLPLATGIVIANRIQDLDSLPFPLRNSFIHDTKFMDLGNILTGRGCPHGCTYCASPAIWKRRVILRSVNNVMIEIRQMVDSGIKLIRFCDDTFNIKIDRAIQLCKELIPLGIEWVCDARGDNLNRELLDVMKKSGCRRIKIGVESGSDRILKSIKKGFTVEHIKQGVELIHDADIPLTVYFMCGFPEETDGDVQQTLELAKWMDADYYSISVFTPYFGTEEYKVAEAAGRVNHNAKWETFYHQSGAMIVNDKLNPSTVKELLALNEGRKRI